MILYNYVFGVCRGNAIIDFFLVLGLLNVVNFFLFTLLISVMDFEI